MSTFLFHLLDYDSEKIKKRSTYIFIYLYVPNIVILHSHLEEGHCAKT